MREFPVPFILSDDEEKAFGGKLSYRQAVYIVGGVFLAILVLLMPVIPLAIRIPLAVTPLILGPSLAFGTVHNMRLDRFIAILIRYWRRPKTLFLEREWS